MKQKLKKATYWVSVITLGLVVGISLQMVRANWSAPTTTAPTGNIGAPINTGGGAQTKSGSLGVGGSLSVAGAVQAGAAVAGLVAGDVKGTRLCIGSVCRSSWTDGSSTTTYIQGGYYGRCVDSPSTSISELAAPMIIENRFFCVCPAGFTKVKMGEYEGGTLFNPRTFTVHACLKQ